MADRADRIRPLTKEWHASAAGREWHRQHARRLWEKAGTFENAKNRLQAFERASETTDFVKGEFQIGADLQAGFESRPARAVTAESIRAKMATVPGLERFGSDVHVPDLSFEQAADMQFAEI